MEQVQYANIKKRHATSGLPLNFTWYIHGLRSGSVRQTAIAKLIVTITVISLESPFSIVNN